MPRRASNIRQLSNVPILIGSKDLTNLLPSTAPIGNEPAIVSASSSLFQLEGEPHCWIWTSYTLTSRTI